MADHLSDHIRFLTLVLSDDVNPGRLAELRSTLREHSNESPTCWLHDWLGLDAAEVQIVWLLAAIAADPSVRQLVNESCASSSGDPTLDWIRRLVYGHELTPQALHALSDDGRLRALNIIERSDSGGGTLVEHRQTWALTRRMLLLLLGQVELDSEVRSIAFVDDRIHDLEALVYSDGALDKCRAGIRYSSSVLCVFGLAGLGRRTLLQAVASENNMRTLLVDGRKLSTLAVDSRVGRMRALARECKLLDRVPILLNLDSLSPDLIDIVGSELVSRIDGVVLATCDSRTRPHFQWKRPVVSVDLARPVSSRLEALWRAELGTCSESLVPLSSRYPLVPALVVRAASAARANMQAGGIVTEALRDGVRSAVEDRLGHLATRVTTTQSWNDLVLSSEQMNRIAELIARVRRRQVVLEDWGFDKKVGKGVGVVALFSGPPGTGKSMCAGLIARELEIDLYVVDTAKVTSKWIGETEKNR